MAVGRNEVRSDLEGEAFSREVERALARISPQALEVLGGGGGALVAPPASLSYEREDGTSGHYFMLDADVLDGGAVLG